MQLVSYSKKMTEKNEETIILKIDMESLICIRPEQFCKIKKPFGLEMIWDILN